MKRTKFGPCNHGGLRLLSGGERPFGGERNDGVDARVDRGDAVEVRLDDLDWRDLLRPYEGGQFRRVGICQDSSDHGHLRKSSNDGQPSDSPTRLSTS